MATQGFNENAAFSKLVLRMMVCGTRVLRILLKEQITLHGETVDSFLASRRQDILNKYFMKTNITIMFPLNSQPADIEIWDISLLAHVLSRTCSNLPPKVDKSLQRLKEVRNKIVHKESASVSKTIFEDLSNELESSIEGIATGISDTTIVDQIKDDIQDIEKGMFMQDVPEYQRIIFHWIQQDTLTNQAIENFQQGLY